jgi:hypothetical protein
MVIHFFTLLVLRAYKEVVKGKFDVACFCMYIPEITD